MPKPHRCPGLLLPRSWTLPAHPAASSGPDSTPAPLGAASHPGHVAAATRCCGNHSPSASAGSVRIGKRNHIWDAFLDLHHMKRLPSKPIFSFVPSSRHPGPSKPLHSLPAEPADPKTPPGFALGLPPSPQQEAGNAGVLGSSGSMNMGHQTSPLTCSSARYWWSNSRE